MLELEQVLDIRISHQACWKKGALWEPEEKKYVHGGPF